MRQDTSARQAEAGGLPNLHCVNKESLQSLELVHPFLVRVYRKFLSACEVHVRPWLD